jgi:hypothetical protein
MLHLLLLINTDGDLQDGSLFDNLSLIFSVSLLNVNANSN